VAIHEGEEHVVSRVLGRVGSGVVVFFFLGLLGCRARHVSLDVSHGDERDVDAISVGSVWKRDVGRLRRPLASTCCMSVFAGGSVMPSSRATFMMVSPDGGCRRYR